MKTQTPGRNNFFSVSLAAVATVFILLFLLTLAIINLRFLFTPQTIKTRLQKTGFYSAASEQLKGFLISYLASSQVDLASLESGLREKLTPLWLQTETERNLDQLGNYLRGDIDQLELNLTLPSLQEEKVEQMPRAGRSSGSPGEEIVFPDKVDLFGQHGLLPAGMTNSLYQFKITREALNLSLKILIFLMVLTVAVFFLLRPPVTAGQWLGISLGSAGLLGVIMANILKMSSGIFLSRLVSQKFFMAGEMQETIMDLLDSFWQTYLSLISWQSLLALLGGVLILLLSFFLKTKEEL